MIPCKGMLANVSVAGILFVCTIGNFPCAQACLSMRIVQVRLESKYGYSQLNFRPNLLLPLMLRARR
jgi:hypothetical protein